METDCDVIIIGAGFCGLTLRRELTQRGFTVETLEGRDRIGGRTWTDHRLGHQLELGGTWVHPLQPHVWSEITRHGIDLVASPEPTQAYWWADGQRQEGRPEELFGLLAPGIFPLLAESRTIIPDAYRPLDGPDIKAMDRLSVAERLDQLDLDDTQRAFVDAYWTMIFGGPLTEVGYAQILRLGALAYGDFELLWEAAAKFKLARGTRSLAEAIAADGGDRKVRLNTTAAAVHQDGDGVAVTAESGEVLRARAAVVAVPINAMRNIEFSPRLSPEKAAAIDRGYGEVARMVKLWIRIRGHREPFVAFGDHGWPVGFASTEYELDDSTLLVAFGSDHTAVDLHDPRAVEDGLRRLIPDVEVMDITGHDWVADRFSCQAVSYQRKGQLTNDVPALQTPDGRIWLAGSDLANGWAGFIDGAIEQGFQVTLQVAKALEKS